MNPRYFWVRDWFLRVALPSSTKPVSSRPRLKPLQRKASWFQFLCFYSWRHLGLFLLSGISYQSMTGRKCTSSLCDWPSKAQFSDICPKKPRKRARHIMKMILTVWLLEQSSSIWESQSWIWIEHGSGWQAEKKVNLYRRRIHVEERNTSTSSGLIAIIF